MLCEIGNKCRFSSEFMESGCENRVCHLGDDTFSLDYSVDNLFYDGKSPLPLNLLNDEEDIQSPLETGEESRV